MSSIVSGFQDGLPLWPPVRCCSDLHRAKQHQKSPQKCTFAYEISDSLDDSAADQSHERSFNGNVLNDTNFALKVESDEEGRDKKVKEVRSMQLQSEEELQRSAHCYGSAID